MVHAGRSIHRRTLIAALTPIGSRFGLLLTLLLLLLIALAVAACGGSPPNGAPAGDSQASAETTPASPAGGADAGGVAPESPVLVAEPEATPRPTATPASQVANVHWTEETADASFPWVVTGGSALVESERYCLTPSGAETALAVVPVSALTSSGDVPYGILSAQVLASPPNVEGTSVGLAACGVLLEVNDQQQWRQSPRDAGGPMGAPGEWQADPRLPMGGQHALGVLCESRTTWLVGDGAILAEQESSAAAGTQVGLSAAVAGGAGEAVCYDDLRVEVWPDKAERAGDDRQAFLYELGNPDAFVIEFEQTPEGGLYRVETWTYSQAEMALTFEDGVLIETAGVDPSADDIAAWPVSYDPLAFDSEMTLDDVQTFLAGQELVSLDVPAEFGAGMVLYAGDQIVFGFTEGTLEFVQTLAVGVGPEEVAP